MTLLVPALAVAGYLALKKKAQQSPAPAAGGSISDAIAAARTSPSIWAGPGVVGVASPPADGHSSIPSIALAMGQLAPPTPIFSPFQTLNYARPVSGAQTPPIFDTTTRVPLTETYLAPPPPLFGSAG